jgi:hypothetical protein
LNHVFIRGNDETMMKLHVSQLLLALVLTPAMLAAGPFDGVYKQTANAECALVGVEGGALKIERNIFYGVNVECRMANPVDIVNMDATLYDMQCSGEGETWTERAMLMTDAEGTGIYMIWNRYAFRYQRCDAADS